jgi:hypothetical protein
MRRRAFIAILGSAALLVLAVPANAEWLEASSDHFVIYSDRDDMAARRFAERLERFHGAMAYVYARSQPKPGPSNRVTVFVVSSRSANLRAAMSSRSL